MKYAMFYEMAPGGLEGSAVLVLNANAKQTAAPAKVLVSP